MNLQKIIRSLVIAILFLVPFFPLIVANSFFFPFITGKAFYFRILVELAFAAWIILAFLDAKYRPKFTALNVAVTLFAVVTLLADLLGVNPLRSLLSNFERMEGWITIIHLWAFFVVASSIFGSGEAGKQMWHRWFNVSLLVATYIGIYGIAQLTGHAAIHQGTTRIDATLGNAEYMAVYMLFHVFLAAYMSIVAFSRRITNASVLRVVYPILGVFFVFILAATQTRGTILGLLGGIMLALFLYALLGKKAESKYRWISGSILVLILLCGLTFWLNKDSSFVKNNGTLNRLATISINDYTTQARGYIWPMAIKGALERPLYGWGQENFNYLFNQYYNPKMWAQEQWFDRAHSVYLDWLVDSGFIGLIIYLSLYVLFLRSLWKSSLTIGEKSVLTGLLVGYAIHNAFVFDNLASYAMFFAMLGFADSWHVGTPIKMLGSKPYRIDAVEYIIAPAAIVVLVGLVYFWNIRPIEANTRLITALSACQGSTPSADLFNSALSINTSMANQEIHEQLLGCAGNVINNQQIPGPTQQAFFDLAVSGIQNQIKATPKDARIYMLGGTFLNGAGQFQSAGQLLTKAHDLSPGKQTIDFQLATDYVNSGENTAALSLLKQAYDSSTDDTDAAAAYAIALVISGDEAEAHQIFGNDPAIFTTDRMAQVYMSLKQYPKAVSIYRTLLAADPKNLQYNAALAQVEFLSGDKAGAVAILQSIEKDHPEYATSIDAAIKQIQAAK